MGRAVENKILIPSGVSCSIEGDNVVVKGPKGVNKLKLANFVNLDSSSVVVTTKEKSLLNTRVTLIKNAFKGVTEGFEVSVMLYGVGYKVVQSGNMMEFFLGYSHTIKIAPPSDVTFEIKSPTQFLLRSASKMSLGDFLAKVTKLRKSNPYKTKGVIQEGAFIRKKEGKK